MTSQLPDTGCPFCKRIASGEFGAHSEDAVTFEPLNPVTPGHVLVVPRKHIADVGEDPWLAARTMRLAALMASRLDSANIITSLGGPATQTVFHAHLHVVPRHEGDGLHLPWTAALPELTAAITAQATTTERERILSGDDNDPDPAGSVYRLGHRHGRADERERIRQRLTEHVDAARNTWDGVACCSAVLLADLLGGTADGAHAPGGAT